MTIPPKGRQTATKTKKLLEMLQTTSYGCVWRYPTVMPTCSNMMAKWTDKQLVSVDTTKVVVK
jgi:hypothetical protein